jgi:hypothetical protein
MKVYKYKGKIVRITEQEASKLNYALALNGFGERYEEVFVNIIDSQDEL